jgi:hypothetical protein
MTPVPLNPLRETPFLGASGHSRREHEELVLSDVQGY